MRDPGDSLRGERRDRDGVEEAVQVVQRADLRHGEQRPLPRARHQHRVAELKRTNKLLRELEQRKYDT